MITEIDYFYLPEKHTVICFLLVYFISLLLPLSGKRTKIDLVKKQLIFVEVALLDNKIYYIEISENKKASEFT